MVPSLLAIGRALLDLIVSSNFYWHLGVTAFEILVALALGGAAGTVIGLLLGANRFLSNAFEAYLYYLGPTPKIIFFPVMIMLFGIGPGSKIAMGAISCFFPIALSAAAGVRQVDEVLLKVGRSFHAKPWQMVTKVYVPAMRHPIVNGVRLGFGIALIGTLLAETKLSNRGIGHLVTQAYTLFDMPRMYAILVILFSLAIGANVLIARCAGLGRL